MRLSGFGGAVAALHVAGWGLFVYYSGRYPALAGLGVLAYTFGLRHAFDADHIAAIDNTTRKLLQQGKRPLGVGFFFSLGHSTIVLSLTAGLAIAARTVKSQIPVLQTYGGTIGAGVSGTFLWIIGVLNLIVLLDIVRIYGEIKRGQYDRERLEERLQDRGFMNRFFLGRFFGLISKSWHMYPLGILFGLGFDTATEVGLLALAAGRREPRRPVPRRALAPDPVRGRHVVDGHGRRRVHDASLRLGVLESDPEGLLQHHRHVAFGDGRACGRLDRAPSGGRDRARARLRILGLAERSQLRESRATESSGSSSSPGWAPS